ncbi:MAG TPA: M48 family metallopeptidase [Mycobacteriales bacterium]|nr:M48 family metallopeptidase [Mycobacteriales bacterium]
MTQDASPGRVRISFPEISSRAWEHPADRGALVALRSLSGFDTVLKVYSGLMRERGRRLLYLASAVRVGGRQFRGVDALYTDCAGILDIPRRPELFVTMDPMPHAMTLGMDTPFIVVSSGLLDLLDDEELRTVLGHELGHARSGHAVYRTMLLSLVRMPMLLGWFPLGGWTLRAIVAALQEWQRKSELSADRAGLLAGQDLDAALRVHMKVAGGARLADMDVAAFLDQAVEYQATGDLRDSVLKLLNLELRSHPFSVLRAAELSKWVREGDYDRILRGEYPRRADDAGASIGEEARAAARSYRDGFDVSADPLVAALRGLGDGLAGAAGGLRDAVSGWVRSGRRPDPDQ